MPSRWSVALISGVAIAAVLGALVYPLTDPKHSGERTDTQPGPSHFQNAQGLWLYTRTWRPQQQQQKSKPTKGVVYLVHGLGEHITRYDHFATQLNEQGFVVKGLDLQGHGRSQGDRVYVEDYNHYFEEVIMFIEQENKKDPELNQFPHFLFGHSNGGFVATAVALRRPELLQGLILSAPAIQPSPEFAKPHLVVLAKLFGSLLPKLRLSRLGTAKLTHDPVVLEELLKDPHHFKGSLPAGLGSSYLSVSEEDIIPKLNKISHPLLILMASDDELVYNPGVQMAYDKATSEDKTLKIYEGYYHEILFEIGKEKAYVDIAEWLNKHS